MMPGAPGHHHQDTRSPRLWNAGFIRQAGEPRVGLPDESSVPVVVSGTPTNDGRANLPVCPNLSASKRSDAGGTMGIRTKEKHLPLLLGGRRGSRCRPVLLVRVSRCPHDAAHRRINWPSAPSNGRLHMFMQTMKLSRYSVLSALVFVFAFVGHGENVTNSFGFTGPEIFPIDAQINLQI